MIQFQLITEILQLKFSELIQVLYIFNNFNYKSDFQVFPNDVVQFQEIFKDTSGSKKTRQNIHKMWIPSKLSVIKQCKEAGFINYAQVDLLMAQMEYQYLYVFQKPE